MAALEAGDFPGTAPWVLTLAESDWLAPDAIEIILRLAAGEGEAAGLYRLGLLAAPGWAPSPERLLVRRASLGAAASAAAGPGPLPTSAAARSLLEGAPVVEVATATVAPLGLAARGSASAPRWLEPAGLGLDLDSCEVLGWEMDQIAARIEGSGDGWILLGGPGWVPQLAAIDVERKAAVLVGNGAAAVVFCHDPQRRAAWQTLHPAVGETVQVAAIVCRIGDLVEALDPPDVANGVESPESTVLAESPESAVLARLLGIAAGSGMGCAYRHVGQGVLRHGSPGAAGIAPSVNVLIPPATVPRDRGALPVWVAGTSLDTAELAGWAPRSVLPLELVFDRAQRALLLSSPFAPLPAADFPERTVIGGVDGLAFPGTQPVFVHDGWRLYAGPEAPPSEPGGASGRLLGYFPRGALNDCSSLYRRSELGRAALQRLFGADLGSLVLPGSDVALETALEAALETALDAALMVYRAPSPWPDPQIGASSEQVCADRAGEEYATSVVEVFDGAPAPMIFRHPDVLGVAFQADRPARRGAGLAASAAPDRRPVRGVDTVVGHGRVVSRAGDGEELGPGGVWHGLAPPGDAAPLLRWESEQGPRYSTQGRPRRADGSPDRSARFVHMLGWARPAGTPGAVALYEWFHPRRRRWLYGSDPEEGHAGGFRLQGRVCGLDHRPGPAGVALYRSPLGRSGATLVHCVAAEAAVSLVEPLNGWLQLPVELGATPAGAAGETPPAQTPPAQTTPWPGAWPVVEMVRGEGERRVTAHPLVLLRQGWVARSVLGYTVGPGAGAGVGPGMTEDEVSWLLDALDLPRHQRVGRSRLQRAEDLGWYSLGVTAAATRRALVVSRALVVRPAGALLRRLPGATPPGDNPTSRDTR